MEELFFDLGSNTGMLILQRRAGPPPTIGNLVLFVNFTTNFNTSGFTRVNDFNGVTLSEYTETTIEIRPGLNENNCNIYLAF